MDSADTVDVARRWVANSSPGVRFWAALILLRHGNRETPEGLDVLDPILANDDGTRYYPVAVEPLVATRNERALKMACGILKKEKVRGRPGWTSATIVQRLLLAGRQECLDYLLAKLDSEKSYGYSSGMRGGKLVQQTLVEGDDIAQVIASWHANKCEYDTLAPDKDRRIQRKKLKTWCADQFALIRAGKRSELKPPEVLHLIDSPELFLDAP